MGRIFSLFLTIKRNFFLFLKKEVNNTEKIKKILSILKEEKNKKKILLIFLKEENNKKKILPIFLSLQ